MVERTEPLLWEQIKYDVINMDIAGTRAGQWSARKAQLAVRVYKENGGGYIKPKNKNNSLSNWTSQNWQTLSGLPSHLTGERYLPEKAIKSLTKKEYEETSRQKRIDMNNDIQYSRQPKYISDKVKKYRE